MKRSVLTASFAGLLVLASSPAFAKGKPPPSPPPPPPDNTAEWTLINLSRTATGGDGVTVAVFDGLTDCRHTGLNGPGGADRCDEHMIPGGRYRFYDSHGTHVAGIIAGATTGVAPRANITNYAVFDDRFYVATGSKLITAWTDAYSDGARIANMSFGCDGMAFCFTADEVRAMGSAGLPMLFVKAAGNEGVNFATESVAVTHAQALAALERTILVGSVELGGTISGYSNRPGNGCLLYSGDTSCDADMKWMNYFIVAPGSTIYSTLPGNGFGLMSGTSMATPMVAGAAALLKQTWPGLTPEQMADILFSTAVDLGAADLDPVYGHGLLNVGAALQPVGDVNLLSSGGGSTEVNSATFSSSPTFSKLAQALGGVSVYDRYGRDFPLTATRLQLRRSYDTIHRLLGRRLIGLGGQADWASALFETRHAVRGFSAFGSFARACFQRFRAGQNAAHGHGPAVQGRRCPDTDDRLFVGPARFRL